MDYVEVDSPSGLERRRYMAVRQDDGRWMHEPELRDGEEAFHAIDGRCAVVKMRNPEPAAMQDADRGECLPLDGRIICVQCHLIALSAQLRSHLSDSCLIVGNGCSCAP